MIFFVNTRRITSLRATMTRRKSTKAILTYEDDSDLESSGSLGTTGVTSDNEMQPEKSPQLAEIELVPSSPGPFVLQK